MNAALVILIILGIVLVLFVGFAVFLIMQNNAIQQYAVGRADALIDEGIAERNGSSSAPSSDVRSISSNEETQQAA